MTAGLWRDDEASPVASEGAEWIGPYRLVRQLGEGGMGVVHLALAPSGRMVAIKVLREHIAHDHEARSRLAREVQTLARVQDSRVAAVLDADTEGLRPYIVTRYIPGPALDRVVSESGPLQGDALVRLGRGLTGALHAIHAVGVIHRDLKPANVLLLDGDPVVIDFGIAHVADDIRLTMTGLVMGTPGYLSPEVVEGGSVTEATDWWGWAATLAFGASGVPPFGRGPMGVVLDRVRRGQADLSGVDARLAPLLRAALSPMADERPLASEIIEALDRYAEGAPATVAVPVTDPLPFAPRQPPTPSATQALDQGQGLADARLPDEVSDPESDPGWWSGWEDERGHPDPRIELPFRIGTLLALMVGVLGIAAVWPVVALGLIIAWFWCARFADRSVTSLVVRRHERGRRRRDVPLAAVLSPWHLISSAVATVIALLLPTTVVIASTFSAALAIAAIFGGNPQPARSLPLVAGGFFGLMLGWWGPGGASLRRGSRSLVRGVAPGKVGAEIAVTALLLLGAGLGVVAWQRLGQPDVWPLVTGRFPLAWPFSR